MVEAQLKELTLTPVIETGRKLGSGAYGEVVEVRLSGLNCAGKKLHKEIFKQSPSEQKEMRFRFVEECLRLSKLRHPKIVQLMGVHFIKDSQLPMMVMELLPTSLTDCLERHQQIPGCIKNSILFDISLALLYLHSQTPPLIHRNLTGNNVLLTSNMNAKLADLSVAKIVNLNPAQLTARMTKCPGFPEFMPPEALSDVPQYNEKLDIFSFGNLILQVCNQKLPLPDPLLAFDPQDPENLKPRTEVQRRQKHLNLIEEGNPLRALAEQCLHNAHHKRPTSATITKKLEQIHTSGASSIPDFVCLSKEKLAITQLEQENVTLKQQTSDKDVIIAQLSNKCDLSAQLASVTVEAHCLRELLNDAVREMAPVTGDAQLTALQEETVNILSNPPSESSIAPAKFDDRAMKLLQEKMLVLIECVQRKRSDQDHKTQRLEMEVKMSHKKDTQISKLKADLERANQEKQLLKHDTPQMEGPSGSKESQHSLQAKDQRIATLESELSAKETQLTAALNTKKKQCSDAEVQTNYLAVAEFGLKEVEIAGEKIFEVTADSSYHWASHGFQLTVPSGALPPGVTAAVAVKSIVAGHFKLPENSELIGAIYCISSSHIFEKKVTVHLQHCATINTEAECNHFKIIIGKCSQDPPYTFAMEDGVFTPKSQTATMSVTQNSAFGMVYSYLGNAPQPVQRLYRALIFHKQIDNMGVTWEIVLVVVQDLHPFVEVVQKKYREFICCDKFTIQFEEESEQMSIEMSADEKLWHISFKDSTGTSISKGAVDTTYQDGQLTTPSYHFFLQRVSHTDVVKDLILEVKLAQKTHPPRFLRTHLNISSQPRQSSAPPDQPILNKEQLFDVKKELPNFTEWRKLGANLGHGPGILEVIETDFESKGAERCLDQVLLQWLKRNHNEAKYGPPTWFNLSKALELIDSSLAIKIRDKHP